MTVKRLFYKPRGECRCCCSFSYVEEEEEEKDDNTTPGEGEEMLPRRDVGVRRAVRPICGDGRSLDGYIDAIIKRGERSRGCRKRVGKGTVVAQAQVCTVLVVVAIRKEKGGLH